MRRRWTKATAASAAVILLAGIGIGETAAFADDGEIREPAQGLFGSSAAPSQVFGQVRLDDVVAPQPKNDTATTPYATPVSVKPLANDANVSGFHVSRLTDCTPEQGIVRWIWDPETEIETFVFEPAGGGTPMQVETESTSEPGGAISADAGTWNLLESQEPGPESAKGGKYTFTPSRASAPTGSGDVWWNTFATEDNSEEIALVSGQDATSNLGQWHVKNDTVTFTPASGAEGTACAIVWLNGSMDEVTEGEIDDQFLVGMYPSLLRVTVEQQRPTFSDVSRKHPFFGDIEWMVREGVTTGIAQKDGSAKYEPKWKVTREAMAAFLYRLNAPKGYQAPAKSPFADVAKGDPFYTEISWMADEGISTGIAQKSGEPKFAPKSKVTREAMAAFMYRLDDGKKPALPASSPFADVKKGDRFYREIAWMKSTGLSTGIKQSSGKPAYEPKWQTSREAMAAFLHRAAK